MPRGVYPRTERHRAIMSASRIGRPNPHPGIKKSQEIKDKIAETLRKIKNTPEEKAKVSAVHSGRKRPIETRMKIAAALKKAYSVPERCPNWHGGISFEPYCPKFNDDLRERVRAYFGHRCVLCGRHESECGEKHSVHHVEYNKKACCDGKPVQFAALCRVCHGKTSRHRTRWEDMLHVAIDEIYGGRSYFTRDEVQSKLSEA